MIISEYLLLAYGGEYVTYLAGEVLFREGECPKFYFQIVKGIIELNNYNEDGKVFTHNILSDGQSIGESLLLNNKPYPVSAITKTPCTLLIVRQIDYLLLIQQNTEVMMNMIKCMAERMYYNYLMLPSLSSTDAYGRIKIIMDYLKASSIDSQSYQIPYTRQQIANLTGLRVETVIRMVKRMELENIVKIKNRKIFY